MGLKLVMAPLALALGVFAGAASASPGPADGAAVDGPREPQGIYVGENGGLVTPSRLPPAVVRPDAGRGLAKLYGGTPISVTTYHYDNGRTGWNPNETDLTPATVASDDFGLLKIISVDGSVTAQPLVGAGYLMPDGKTRNLLVIATTKNSVYAFDADNYSQLWHVNFGPPQTDVNPICPKRGKTGIIGTPVIGPGAAGKRVIYVVAMVQPVSGTYHTQVHALDLGTGKDVVPAVTATAIETLPSGATVAFDPSIQFNRTGLALNNGNLYFGVGASCENGAYQTTGWVFRFDTGLSSAQAYPMARNQTTDKIMGGVWMSGFAPAVDPQGNVFVSTGNGSTSFSSPQALASSILKLSPDLSSVVDYFTPANYALLDQTDGDMSSGGVMLLPPLPDASAHPLAVAMGKNPTLYLLDQTAMGGFSSTNGGAVQTLSIYTGKTVKTFMGVWGGPAFYNGPAGPTVYYYSKGDNLKAYHLTTGAKPSLAFAAQATSAPILNSGVPTVSSNGSTPGTGIVWVVKRTSPTTLEAYDAVNLGAPIYQSSAAPYIGISQTPVVANGRVYVAGSGPGGVYVFGLVN